MKFKFKSDRHACRGRISLFITAIIFSVHVHSPPERSKGIYTECARCTPTSQLTGARWTAFDPNASVEQNCNHVTRIKSGRTFPLRSGRRKQGQFPQPLTVSLARSTDCPAHWNNCEISAIVVSAIVSTMAEPGSSHHIAAVSGLTTGRKKMRKGTQSCTECNPPFIPLCISCVNYEISIYPHNSPYSLPSNPGISLV